MIFLQAIHLLESLLELWYKCDGIFSHNFSNNIRGNNMLVVKKLAYAFLTLSLISFVGVANAYQTRITYDIINDSNVNLTGLPSHTSIPKQALNFPADRTFAYSLSYGVAGTDTRLCVGIGINNFASPYVGTYTLTNDVCAVVATTQKNNDTDYTVIIKNR